MKKKIGEEMWGVKNGGKEERKWWQNKKDEEKKGINGIW